MNMELDEMLQQDNTTTNVSQVGDAWDFMNIGMQVGSNPEVEMRQPPGWTNCGDTGSEGKLTIT
jgi:hypothetical protein